MKSYNLHIALIFLLPIVGCVDKYDHNSNENNISIVVEALITDEQEEQKITLTQSTAFDSPYLNPLNNVSIEVYDLFDNKFEFVESDARDGNYYGFIPNEYLIAGNAFKLEITTENNDKYESEFEEMIACPKVDSIYYEVFKEYYIDGNSQPENGAHFYLDLNAQSNFGEYYRWQIDETFEYRAMWPIKTYWAGEFFDYGADYSLYFCYKTTQIPQIFTATTSNLTHNTILKFPLHFVNNTTQRLYYRYSLLVKQMSINETIFNYWEALKGNNQNSGGLYDSQPVDVKSNVVCTTNPDKLVLGYFGVSSVETKRVLYNEFKGIIHDPDVACYAYEVSDAVLESYPFNTWPVYIAPAQEGKEGYLIANKSCFDCTLDGGSTELPDFWKN